MAIGILMAKHTTSKPREIIMAWLILPFLLSEIP